MSTKRIDEEKSIIFKDFKYNFNGDEEASTPNPNPNLTRLKVVLPPSSHLTRHIQIKVVLSPSSHLTRHIQRKDL